MSRPEGSWLSLNGLWEVDYERSPEDLSRDVPFGHNQTLRHSILVPFPIESSLGGLRKLAPNYTAVYRKALGPGEQSFVNACQAGSKGTVLLHFERVDWNSSVWLNGVRLCSHVGGYAPFTCTLPTATASTDNEIILAAYDATEDNAFQMFGKQQRAAFSHPSGFMYTSSSGIWDTVWLECVPAYSHIVDVHIQTHISGPSVEFAVQVNGISDHQRQNATVRVYAADGTTFVASGTGPVDASVKVSMPNAPSLRTWSPQDPYLYNATVTLEGGDEQDNIDQVSVYFGMRSISVGRAPESSGEHPIILLNNKPFYPLGVLDQGWFPAGLYAAPTDAALASDLTAMKAMGFNAVRKHMKVDTRRWFYHADRLGLVVWQDLPQWSGSEDGYESIFQSGTRDIWKSVRNSPALVQWNAYNEGWGEGDPSIPNRTISLLRSLEGDNRLLDDASGGRGFGCADGWVDPTKCPGGGQGPSRCMSIFWTGGCAGDIADHHNYPDPEVPYDLGTLSSERGRVFVQGEYGGFGVAVEGHQWAPNGCAGGSHKSFEEPLFGSKAKMRRRSGSGDNGLEEAFVQYNKEAGRLLNNGLAGQIFTQISDIECELNGLLTYDRVPKVNFSAIARANAELLANATRLGLHSEQ